MAMRSQPAKYDYATCYFSHGGTVLWPSSYEEFKVTPSPCTNGTGRTRPGVYSFEVFRQSYLRGALYGGYYWGNPGNRKYVADNRWGNINGYYPHMSLPAVSVLSDLQRQNAYNVALNKFYDKLKDSELNVSTSVGEGRETLHMLRSIASSSLLPAARLSEILRTMDRSTRNSRLSDLPPHLAKKWRAGLATVGGLWLFWHVGLEPFLRDLEAFWSHELKRSEDIKFQIKARSTREAVYTVADWQLEDKHRYEFGATIRITDTHAFENWRAGLVLRPSVAWELVTLSFVVDYVINIGNYAASLEAAIGNNGFFLEDGYVTAGMKRSGTANFVRESGDQSDMGAASGVTWHVTGSGYGDAYGYYSMKSRSLLTSLPLPSAPVIKIPKASQQLLTVAALLSQILVRRPR